jgi:hypothetical protein
MRRIEIPRARIGGDAALDVSIRTIEAKKCGNARNVSRSNLW